jgi:hypothetical protein
MCRNIRKLRHDERLPTDDELRAAALQFIRKISGYRVPAERNRPAFDAAVTDVAQASRHLFERLVTVPRTKSKPSHKPV